MQRPSGVCVFVCVCGPLGMRMGPQVCAGAYWCVCVWPLRYVQGALWCVCGPSGVYRGPSDVCLWPLRCAAAGPNQLV